MVPPTPDRWRGWSTRAHFGDASLKKQETAHLDPLFQLLRRSRRSKTQLVQLKSDSDSGGSVGASRDLCSPCQRP